MSAAAVVRVEREFAATPEEVFDAWTNPEVLIRWWGARSDAVSPGCDVDLRVGGRYVLKMIDGAGEVRAVAGEYREIDRPRRLVYTWAWEAGGAMPPDLITLVTVEFVPLGARTRVVLEHAGFDGEETRGRHHEGWEGAFDNLAQRIFGEPTAT